MIPTGFHVACVNTYVSDVSTVSVCVCMYENKIEKCRYFGQLCVHNLLEKMLLVDLNLSFFISAEAYLHSLSVNSLQGAQMVFRDDFIAQMP